MGISVTVGSRGLVQEQVAGGSSFTLPGGAQRTIVEPSMGAIDSTGQFMIPGIFPYGAFEVATGSFYFAPLTCAPHGATIRSFGLKVDPQSIATPGTATQIDLFRISRHDGSLDVITTLLDPLTGTAYRAEHVLSASSINHVIDRENYQYFMDCGGETGANGAPVTVVGQFFVTFTEPDERRGS